MTKTYNTPMLQIISINKTDIIATSTDAPISGTQANESALSPCLRGFDSWDAGY